MGSLQWSGLEWAGGGTGLVPIHDIFPEYLESVARFELAASFRKLLYHNGHLFCGCSSPRVVIVLDAKDATQEVVIQRSQVPGMSAVTADSYGLAFNADRTRLYVGGRRTSTTAVEDGMTLGYLTVFDISNPDITKIVNLGTFLWNWDSATYNTTLEIALVTAIDYFRKDGRDYVVIAGNDEGAGGQTPGGQTGFFIMDVTDPANIFRAGAILKRNDSRVRPHGVCILNNRYAILGNYTAPINRISCVDCIDPANPIITSGVNPTALAQPGVSNNTALIWGTAAYPDSLTVAGAAAMGTAASVQDGTEWIGFVMVDISDPNNMQILGEARIPHEYVDTTATADVPPRDLVFRKQGNKVWAIMPNGEHAAAVFDVTDPSNPVFKHNSEFTGDYGVVLAHSGIVYDLDGQTYIAIGDGHSNPVGSPVKGVTVGKVVWQTS